MSNRAPKQSRLKKTAKKAQKAKSRISLWTKALGAATLIGGAAAVLTFLSRPSVSVSDPVDPDNAFSSAFTVTNGNFVPLKDVSVGIALGKIQWTKEGSLTGADSLSGNPAFLTDTLWEHHDLGMDEKFTISPSQFFNTKDGWSGPNGVAFESADIAIMVKYKPWFIPYRQSKVFRFQSHRQTNGKIYWYSIPLK
jgi:hypothetical protein